MYPDFQSETHVMQRVQADLDIALRLARESLEAPASVSDADLLRDHAVLISSLLSSSTAHRLDVSRAIAQRLSEA